MKNNKIARMTTIALLIALILVMQSISAAIPPVSGFTISLVLIPIVLGAAMLGAGAGGLLGAVFGLIVFVNCVNGSDAGGHMVFQASPVFCFLVVVGKGTLAGLASGGVYALLKRHTSGYVAMLCAAAICPIVNTGTFILSMLTIFPDVLNTWAASLGGNVVAYVFSGLLLMNFVPEIIINLAFSPASQRILTAVHGR